MAEQFHAPVFVSPLANPALRQPCSDPDRCGWTGRLCRCCRGEPPRGELQDALEDAARAAGYSGSPDAEARVRAATDALEAAWDTEVDALWADFCQARRAAEGTRAQLTEALAEVARLQEALAGRK